MREEVFGPIVLIVTVGVVDGREVLIAFRNLPDDHRAASGLARRADVALPAMEVGEGYVQPIPPDPGIVQDVLVVAGVAIRHVVEQQIVGTHARGHARDTAPSGEAPSLLAEGGGIESAAVRADI